LPGGRDAGVISTDLLGAAITIFLAGLQTEQQRSPRTDAAVPSRCMSRPKLVQRQPYFVMAASAGEIREGLESVPERTPSSSQPS